MIACSSIVDQRTSALLRPLVQTPRPSNVVAVLYFLVFDSLMVDLVTFDLETFDLVTSDFETFDSVTFDS